MSYLFKILKLGYFGRNGKTWKKQWHADSISTFMFRGTINDTYACYIPVVVRLRTKKL